MPNVIASVTRNNNNRNIYKFFCAGICVKVKGEANTCWTTDKQEMDERGQYRDETQTVTAHETYFEMKYYLVGSSSSKIHQVIKC